MNDLGQYGAARTTSPTSPAGGDRFRIIGQRGQRVVCPPGTQTESTGKLGTGQPYAWCYRKPAPPPRPAAPPPPPNISVSVPTSVATQVSPQISPTMAQQQASPGASVAAQPVSAPGAPSTSTGITAEQLKDIFREQERTRQAEIEAERLKRQGEIQSMQRTMAERAAAQQEIMQTEREAAAEREAARAEATASQPAPQYIPAPPSMPVMSAPQPEPVAPAPEGATATAAEPETEIPWALILLAAGGVGALVVMGRKRSKRKR